jgi:broad specificity phosphatase PhoE
MSPRRIAEPTHLWLIRHAEVEEAYHEVFGGRINMGLSAEGLKQAGALGRWFAGERLDAVYCSPMRRTRETLKAMAVNGTPKPVFRPALQEVDFGDWSGLGWHEVWTRYKVRATEWLDCLEIGAVPNGESAATFRARVEPCLRKIIRDHPGEQVAILAHGGVIRMMLGVLLWLPLPETAVFEIDYASVTHLALLPHGTEIHLLNFAPWRDCRP